MCHIVNQAVVSLLPVVTVVDGMRHFTLWNVCICMYAVIIFLYNVCVCTCMLVLAIMYMFIPSIVGCDPLALRGSFVTKQHVLVLESLFCVQT